MIQRSPELEVLASGDEPAIADRNVRRKQLIGGGALILAGIVAGYVVVAGGRPQQRDMLSGDEEFSTTTFRPPSFVRDGEPQPKPAEPEVLQIPPPPPPTKAEANPDTTEFNVPPPPPPAAAPEPDIAAAPPADEFPKRYRSNMVVFDNKASTGEQLGSAAGEGQGAAVAGEDRNSKYLAAAINLADRTAKARKIDRIDALVPEGTLIPGILETAIVSDLPGQIRAIVSQDVYSFDGRRVLIPTGTRLIGEYQSDIVRGQKRIFVIWTRMLRDDGVSVRETLEGLLKRTRRPDRRAEIEAKLHLPPLPRALLYLWRIYLRLRRRKAGNGFGPSPIEWPDIAAFVQFARLSLTPFEIRW